MADSFEDAKRQMQTFSNSFARPFHVRYDAKTQRLHVDKHLSIEAPE
jgi:hypothetical protein